MGVIMQSQILGQDNLHDHNLVRSGRQANVTVLIGRLEHALRTDTTGESSFIAQPSKLDTS
jgi:hypothetical protein